MQPSEALTTAAQVAVALAGFAGVVVAFRGRAVHEWTAIDKFRLQLLLRNSILPFVFCLIAMLLLTIQPPPSWIWRACSGIAFVSGFIFGLSTSTGARRLPSAEYRAPGTTRIMYYLFGVLGTAALLLQIYNLLLNAFWPFFATICVHLAAAAFQFVRMIASNPDEKADL
jgi:hypothetical protein